MVALVVVIAVVQVVMLVSLWVIAGDVLRQLRSIEEDTTDTARVLGCDNAADIPVILRHIRDNAVTRHHELMAALGGGKQRDKTRPKKK